MRFAPLLLFIAVTAMGQDIQGLRFVQNKGQWNNDIDFQAKVPGGRLGVSSKGFSVQLLDMEEIEHRHLESHGTVNESTGHSATEPVDGHYFRINLLGARLSKPIVETPLEGYYNYFLGNDASRWTTNALAYSTILYRNVYDGIDFRVSSLGNNLKYDFIVRPGADPSQIKIEYEGVDGVEKSDGEIKINTTVGSLSEQKPFSYQVNGRNKETVPSEYRLNGNIASFSFPDDYDDSRTLVIDPLLIFSTYSGSTADNWGSTATPGEHGTLYSAGVTNQKDGGFFPATPGAFQASNHGSYDMAVIKYDSAGTKFLYATLLGGSGNDSPKSLVVDKASGDLIVLGISSSENYPTGSGSFDREFNRGKLIYNPVLDTEDEWDIVVTRLSPNGKTLIGSTFLGGSGNDGLNRPMQSNGPLVANYGDEMRGDVITDEAGNVYISSVTASADFPIVNGFDNSFDDTNENTTEGVIVKLSPDLSSIVWSSYIGGSGYDASYSIKFDNDKNIVLAGGTTSADFPVTAGTYQTTHKGIVDGWIARVTADGSAIMNATFTGTSAFDQVYFVDLNSSGSVFVYGQTTGHMPVTSGVFNRANGGQFLQKFSADLSTLVFSTVFGSGSSNGSVVPNISPTAFLVNDCDNIYMAGWGGFINSGTGFWQSSTFGMPTTSDAFQKTTSGSDFYFIVLNGDATKLVYSTFLGGNSSRTHVDGGTSRFDKYGVVYHSVCSGCFPGNATGFATSDFPTTPNAKSKLNLSTNCNNAAFKFDLSSLTAKFDTNNLAMTMPGFNNVCYPDSIVFENQSIGGKTIVWDFGDQTALILDDKGPKNIIHRYQQPGQYKVKLTISDLSTCSQTDSTVKVINYFKDNIQVGADETICEGNSVQLNATGGADYNWTDDGGAFSSSLQFPVVQPTEATTYFVTVVDANGCMKSDTVQVSVIDSVGLQWQHHLLGNCLDRPGVAVQNLTPPEDDVTFIFDFGDGSTSDQTEVVHRYEKDSLYSLRFAAQREFCVFEEIVKLPVYKVSVRNAITPEGSPGYNDYFEIGFGPNDLAPFNIGIPVQLIVVDRWGKKVFESEDYKNDWQAQNLAGGVYYVHLKVGDYTTCKSWLHIVK